MSLKEKLHALLQRDIMREKLNEQQHGFLLQFHIYSKTLLLSCSEGTITGNAL